MVGVSISIFRKCFCDFTLSCKKKNMVKSLLIQVLLIISSEAITFMGNRKRSLIARFSVIFIKFVVSYIGKKWSP